MSDEYFQGTLVTQQRARHRVDQTKAAKLEVVGGSRPSVKRPLRKNPALRLLVVDDNRDNMLMLCLLLKQEGHIVHVAENGAEALHLAKTFLPDVALLDLLMPGP